MIIIITLNSLMEIIILLSAIDPISLWIKIVSSIIVFWIDVTLMNSVAWTIKSYMS